MCWSSSDHKCSHSRLQAPYKTIFKVFSLSSTSFGLNHLSEILHSSLNRIPDPCLWGFALFFIFICVCLFLPCFCLSFCQPPATAGTARDQLKEYFSFQHSSLISEGSARQLTFRELAIKLWICSLSSWRAATFLAAGCPCIEPMSRALITQKGATQLQRQQHISKPGLSGIESFCFHCSFRDLCSLLWTDSEKKKQTQTAVSLVWDVLQAIDVIKWLLSWHGEFCWHFLRHNVCSYEHVCSLPLMQTENTELEEKWDLYWFIAVRFHANFFL